VFGFQAEVYRKAPSGSEGFRRERDRLLPHPGNSRVHRHADVQDTDVLETSLDGNYFYYVTRYHPSSQSWRMQIQKYDKDFAQVALGSYVLRHKRFSGLVNAAIEEFADGATVGVAGSE